MRSRAHDSRPSPNPPSSPTSSADVTGGRGPRFAPRATCRSSGAARASPAGSRRAGRAAGPRQHVVGPERERAEARPCATPRRRSPPGARQRPRPRAHGSTSSSRSRADARRDAGHQEHAPARSPVERRDPAPPAGPLLPAQTPRRCRRHQPLELAHPSRTPSRTARRAAALPSRDRQARARGAPRCGCGVRRPPASASSASTALERPSRLPLLRGGQPRQHRRDLAPSPARPARRTPSGPAAVSVSWRRRRSPAAARAVSSPRCRRPRSSRLDSRDRGRGRRRSRSPWDASRCATSYSTRASARENGAVQVAGIQQADAAGVEPVEPANAGGGGRRGHGASPGRDPASIQRMLAFVNYLLSAGRPRRVVVAIAWPRGGPRRCVLSPRAGRP